MKTAKIFKNGGSQAVRLPKEFQFDTDEVEIKRMGDAVVLSPKHGRWASLLESLDGFTDDFFAEGRDQGGPVEEAPSFDD